MDQLLAVVDFFAKEWSVIDQAMATFIIALILLGGLIWFVVSRNFALRITNFESELRLSKAQNEAYKAKLDGATPDEARQKIEALERRLQALEPRSLTPDQINKMGAILARHPGMIHIVKDMGSPESARIHTQVEKAFRQNGWQVMSAAAMGVAKTDHGILMTTRSGDRTTEQAQAVMDAFAAVGLAFDRSREPVAPTEHINSPAFPELQILFTDFS